VRIAADQNTGGLLVELSALIAAATATSATVAAPSSAVRASRVAGRAGIVRRRAVAAAEPGHEIPAPSPLEPEPSLPARSSRALRFGTLCIKR